MEKEFPEMLIYFLRRERKGVVLLRVSVAVKRHHDYSNSYKESISLGWLTYSFRGSVHYLHGREHGGM